MLEAISFQINRKTLFVACSNSPEELYARTFMVLHDQMDALTFEEYKFPERCYTLVKASYLKDELATIFELLKMGELLKEPDNTGRLLVNRDERLEYRSQPTLAIFPTDEATTRQILTYWLSSNVKFLETRPNVANPLRVRINKRKETGYRLVCVHES